MQSPRFATAGDGYSDGRGDVPYDVAIIGAGPVGLYLALALSRAGHQVLVVERQLEPYGRPRAVHFDGEIGRLWSALGIADDVRSISETADLYDWQNAQRETLLAFPFGQLDAAGWSMGTMFCQAELERVLATHVEADPRIRVERGEDVVQLTTDNEGVTLSSRGVTVKHRRWRARYVVGCDGANSSIREYVGTTMSDLGYFFDWLVVDLIPQETRTWSPINVQICDPARPTTAVSGGPGRRRFEFMRMPGEMVVELESDEKVWELLAPWDYSPANAELERSVVYTFQARWADRWYADRIAIAGDAAHLMPPFAGQGMCSGIRDAANLAWKLDLVLRGVSAEDLLKTYTTERSFHVKSAIEQSVALGNVICVTDPEAVAARDAFMLANGPNPVDVLPPISPARLGAGVVATDAHHQPLGTNGTLAVPPRVRREGGEPGFWDDVVGAGLGYLVCTEPAQTILDEAHEELLRRVGLTWVHVLPCGSEPSGQAVEDSDDELLPHLSAVGHVAALVRPDNYLYGTATSPSEVPQLLDRYAADLCVLPVTALATTPTEPLGSRSAI